MQRNLLLQFVSGLGKKSLVWLDYVDDFLHAGEEHFDTYDKLEENFNYICFRITQDKNGIRLDQSRYVENIENKAIDPKRALDKHDLLTLAEQTASRQLIGQIKWVVQGSRPDLAFELIDLSTKLKQGNISDLSRAIKAVNRLKDVNSMILFPTLSTDVDDWKVVVFTDASLCNINDGTWSTVGHIVWLVDCHGKCYPLSWHANKIKRVVRVTIAAETLSLQEGLESSFYYRKMRI